MKHLKLIFACLLTAIFSIGQVWAAEGDVVYKLNTATTAIATANSYNKYGPASCASDQSGSAVSTASWKITLGSKQTGSPAGLWLGTNSGNSSKMKLSNGSFSEASAIASALDVNADDTYYTALIGETSFSNVGKVTLTYGGYGNKNPSKAWILYSTDNGSSWSIAKNVTSLSSSGTDFEFDATIASARYALVVYHSAWFSVKVPVLTFYEGATGGTPTCATPSFSPAAGAVLSGTEVSITCATEGATVHYTLDGSDPNASSATAQPIEITSATNIKAIAVKEGSNNSTIATAAYTIATPLTTMDQIFTAATTAGSTATDTYVTFNNWVVTGVKGSNAYVTDGTKGFIIYASGHGFVVGNILGGTAACKVQLYNGSAELTNLTSSTTGLTVNTGGSVSTVVLDAEGIAGLTGANTGSVIKISGAVTETSSKYYIEGVQLWNNLFSFDAPTVGNEYECTGVYCYHSTIGKEIMPRSAEDLTEIVDPGKVATPTFDPEEGAYSDAQNVTITCATEDATIYYTIDGTDPTTSSSVYSTAIAVSETTTIKAFAVKDGMTNSDIASATYTITGPQVTFNYVDYKGQGGPSGTGSSYTMADKPVVSIGNDKFFGNNSYAHFYAGGTVTITPATGVTITRIVLTASAAGYNGYQSEGSITASTGSLSHDGAVVTWTGSADAAFTLENDKQIRWLTIVVTYEEADPSAPALAVTPNVIDFGDVEQGETVTAKKVAVNFANLTGAVTYSGLSSPFSATGTISTTGDEITIAADATVTPGEYEQTLTVTSEDDSKSATVTVTMNVVAAASGDVYNKLTGGIEEGDYVIFYNGKAMKNTISSSRFDYIEVSPVNDKISDPDPSIVWTILQSGEYWTIYNENVSKYAGATGSNNQGALLTEAGDKALWSISGTGEFDITSKYQTDNSKNAYLRNNGTYGFACYAAGTGGKLILFKAVNSKAPAGLAYDVTEVEKLVGAAKFTNAITNDNNLTVAYASSNTEVATVDAASGEVTIVAAGVAEITASTEGDETHKAGSTKYTICVTAHAGTEADPYTVADAKIVIDAFGTKAGVYASGIISQVDAIDLTENFYATYWISANGLTEGQQLEAFHGKYLDNANFSSEDDIKVGDEVVIYGNLKKYGTSIYEFDAANYLISLDRTKESAGLAYAVASVDKNIGDEKFTNTLTNPNNVTVAYSSSNASVASVDAETGEVTVNAMGEATITATFSGNGSYLPGSASYTISVSDPSITKVTFDATVDMTSDAEVLTLTKNGVTMEISKGQMHNGVSYRLNKDQTLTLSCADGLITRIELEGTDPSYAVTNITASGYSAGVWTGSAESVELVASVAQARMTKINVYYGADSREEAGLAWNPASDIELTVGETLSAPALLNPNSIDVAEITIESSNTAVATVTEGVVELVENATGETTITASFAGNTTYKSASVSYKITINAAVVPTTGTTYRKVTATENITDGEYLIVYETTGVAFDGSLETLDAEGNSVAVTINEGVIAGTAAIDAAVFTIDVTAGTLQSASGKYIGVSSNSNGLKQTDNAETYTHTFSIDEDKNAVILAAFEGSTMKLRYNPSTAAGNLRFRYYKNDGQQAIQLYKKDAAPTKDLIRGGLSNGKWGTLCPAQTVENVEGAKFYQISYLVEDELGMPFNMVFDQIGGTTLTAGQPYLFIANADEIRGNKTGDPVASGSNDNGFYGYIGTTVMALPYETDYTATGNNTYVIHENSVFRINGATNLKSERCYININATEPSRGAVAPVPGRHRVTVGVSGAEEAQGIENVGASEKPMKMMIDGQLFIIRGEKMYDATGRLVK